jgi:hypothetical protein
MGNPVKAGSILVLSFHSRPAAVARFVVSIVVDAINRVAGRWARPHVGNEISKGFPSVTDGNATASVPMVLIGLAGMAAPVQHRFPSGVFGRVGRAALSFSGTPTTLGLSSNKQGNANGDGLAAIATTKPAQGAALSVVDFYGRELAKTLSGVIFVIISNWGKLLRSHYNLLVVLVREASGVTSTGRFLHFTHYTPGKVAL